jgi:hypothetical protein
VIKRNKIIQVRLTEKEMQQARDAAGVVKMSLSEMIRFLIGGFADKVVRKWAVNIQATISQ